jgi:glyoxylase-like metal-dependent hydrolase (beta-lactamase superfamily II)
LPPLTHSQLAELGLPKLPIIGGKDCEAVTKTPGNGEGFKIGSIDVRGLYTPCHTQDSICWFMEDGSDKVVFTGDTLFHGGEFVHTEGPQGAETWENILLMLSQQAAASSSKARVRRCTKL